MKRLRFINTEQAIYNDDGKEANTIEPIVYIDELIGIRSAESLVKFLISYPDGLLNATAGCLKGYPSKPYEFWFSEASMIHAVEKLSRVHEIEYLDKMTERQPGSEHEKETCYSIYLPFLFGMREHMINLLCTAAAASGKCEAGFCHEVELSDDVIQRLLATGFDEEYIERMGKVLPDELVEDLKMDREAILNARTGVGVSCSYLWSLLPFLDEVLVDDEVHVALESADERVKHLERLLVIHAHCLGSDEGNEYAVGDGDEIIFLRTDGRNPDVRDVAGYLTTWALFEWNNFYSSYPIMYTSGQLFKLQNTEADSIVRALNEIVASGRFGICEHCGKPFIIKRVDRNGTAYRRYCSRSCSTLACNERKESE